MKHSRSIMDALRDQNSIEELSHYQKALYKKKAGEKRKCLKRRWGIISQFHIYDTAKEQMNDVMTNCHQLVCGPYLNI